MSCRESTNQQSSDCDSKGISICIVSYQTYFWTRLAVERIRRNTPLVSYEILIADVSSKDETVSWLRQQPDVRLFELPYYGRPGFPLDYLMQQARYEIACTIDSDAHPVTPRWVVPAFDLYDAKIVLSGISKSNSYVHPSYMFGKTKWLRRHSFRDRWPKWDTGQRLTQEALDEGLEVRRWPMCKSRVGVFKPKWSDYAGLVWHTWYSSRITSLKPEQIGVEPGYNDVVKKVFRERYQLDF